MSTHRAEMDHYSKTVQEMGGTMLLNLDENGYVDSITVQNLEGVNDFYKSAPISAMENLRPVVGPVASQPVYTKSFPGAEGLTTAKFSESQCRCYSGLNSLVHIMKNRNKIWEGEKFAAVMETENPTVKFFCLDDGDLVEFDERSDLDSYTPSNQGLVSAP